MLLELKNLFQVQVGVYRYLQQLCVAASWNLNLMFYFFQLTNGSTMTNEKVQPGCKQETSSHIPPSLIPVSWLLHITFTCLVAQPLLADVVIFNPDHMKTLIIFCHLT